MSKEVKQEQKPAAAEKKEEKYLLYYRKASNVRPNTMVFDNLDDLKKEAIQAADKNNIKDDMEIFVPYGKVKILKKVEFDLEKKGK